MFGLFVDSGLIYAKSCGCFRLTQDQLEAGPVSD